MGFASTKVDLYQHHTLKGSTVQLSRIYKKVLAWSEVLGLTNLSTISTILKGILNKNFNNDEKINMIQTSKNIITGLARTGLIGADLGIKSINLRQGQILFSPA